MRCIHVLIINFYISHFVMWLQGVGCSSRTGEVFFCFVLFSVQLTLTVTYVSGCKYLQQMRPQFVSAPFFVTSRENDVVGGMSSAFLREHETEMRGGRCRVF